MFGRNNFCDIHRKDYIDKCKECVKQFPEFFEAREKMEIARGEIFKLEKEFREEVYNFEQKLLQTKKYKKLRRDE